MPRNVKRDNFYDLFFKQEADISLMDYLNSSSFDECFTIDTINDEFSRLYHVSGKYYALSNISSTKYSNVFQHALAQIIHPDDRGIFMDLMDNRDMLKRLKESKTPNFRWARMRYRLQNNTFRWVEQCLITGRENGIEEGVVYSFIFDIQNYKNREMGEKIGQQLSSENYHRSELTGLYDEKTYLLNAKDIMDLNPKAKYCMVSIDIENFKLFDEWYDRKTGDMLLASIGTILKEASEEFNGVAGYFGQDDFSMVLPYKDEYIQEVYDRIRKLMSEKGYSVGFLPAFGVVELNDETELVAALDKASIATSRAKKDIKKRIVKYDPNMYEKIAKENEVLSDFVKAMKSHEITFYLQPQTRLSTGKIVGAEALARWVRKDGSIVYPDQFIPVLEKYGFIGELDQYIWEEVCSWLRKSIDAGHDPVPVSVNVSRIDIVTFDIYNYVCKLIEKYNLPPHLFKIEITESAYTESSEVVDALLKKLRQRGFTILMDDFGSGYSSLNMLSKLQIDAIKLDALFLDLEEKNFSIGIHVLESVINMAKIIALPIIVEGVELSEQVNFLENLGVQYAQGYYFYKPIPISEFEKIAFNDENVDRKGFSTKANEQFRIREFLDQNVYSDSMLNNIIGPVAIYAWSGDNVDIVRFNQQFYETVNVPDFSEKVYGIQRVMPEEDRLKLYETLKEAKENRLNGSKAFLRFYTLDGTLTSYVMSYYFIGTSEGADRFYGSAKNITELVDTKQDLALISKYSNDTIIFISIVDGKKIFRIAAHGLESVLGISAEKFEKAFNAGTIDPRIKPEDYQKIQDFYDSGEKEKTFRFSVSLPGKEEQLPIRARIVKVGDESNNVKYILNIELAQ